MPDDLDLGFDTLINRYATHRLFDASALTRMRPDLARIIASPEVTFAAYLADGSVVLCCPDGVPPTLADVVDVLDHSPQGLYASCPDAMSPALIDKLDAIAQKLDLLQRDRDTGAQIADRLEEVKSALLDGLAKASPRDAAAGPDLQHPTLPDAVANDKPMLPADTLAAIQQMLEASEARVLSVVRHASRTQNLAPQMDVIELGIRQVMATTADQPVIRDALMRLENRVEAIVQRPMPASDLLIQRRGIAQFLESMGSILRRLDTAIDRINSPGELAENPQLSQTLTHLMMIVQQLTAPRDITPDLSPLTDMLADLRHEVGRNAQMAQPTAGALHHLAEQIDVLAQRPNPVLDLTQQTQNLAQFTEAMARGLQRLGAAAEVFEAQHNTAAIIAETKALRTDLEVPMATLDAQSEAIADLIKMVADLSERPAPVPDLTVQRQGFAQFGTAISHALQRLDKSTEQHQALARDLQAVAAQAVLGLMLGQKIATDAQATAKAASMDQADGTASLRTTLAEAMAIELMRRECQPVHVG